MSQSQCISSQSVFKRDALVSGVLLLLCLLWTFELTAANQQFCIISPQTMPPKYDSIGKVASLAALHLQLCPEYVKNTCFECTKVHSELRRYEYFAGCQRPGEGTFNSPDLTCRYDIIPCSTQSTNECYPKLLEVKAKVRCKVFMHMKDAQPADPDEQHYCPDHCAAAEALTSDNEHWVCNDCAHVCLTKFSKMNIKKLAVKHCDISDSCTVDSFDCATSTQKSKSAVSSLTLATCSWIWAAATYAIAASFYYLHVSSEL